MAISFIKYPIPIQVPVKNTIPDGSIRNENEDKPLFHSAAGKTDKQTAFAAYDAQINAGNKLVTKHETAHQKESGKQAVGSPVYNKIKDKDGREIIVGGHQMIAMPTFAAKEDPISHINNIIAAATLTVRGAEAPASFDELSGADKAVAFAGRERLAAAEQAKAERISLQQKFGIEPENKISQEKMAAIKSQNTPTNANKRTGQIGKNIDFMG